MKKILLVLAVLGCVVYPDARNLSDPPKKEAPPPSAPSEPIATIPCHASEPVPLVPCH